MHVAATMADTAGHLLEAPATGGLHDRHGRPPPLPSPSCGGGRRARERDADGIADLRRQRLQGEDLSAVKIWAHRHRDLVLHLLAPGRRRLLPAGGAGGRRPLHPSPRTAADNAAGNVSPQASLTFTVDTLPPALSIVWPAAGGATNTATPGILLAYSDAGTGVDVSTPSDDGEIQRAVLPVRAAATSAVTGATCTPTSPFAAGPVTVQATLADHAGHVSAIASVTFQVVLDFTPPVITLAAPSPGSLVNQPSQVLSGQLSKPATLTVNGAPATVQANNSFTYGPITLAEGANAFALVPPPMPSAMSAASPPR